MGMWSRIAGIGMMAAGAYTGNPALIAGGAGVFSAGNSADASKKAADQQQAAVGQANDTLARVDQRTQAGFAPYQQTGQAALGTLSSLMGLPTPTSGTGGGAMGVGALPAGLQQAMGTRMQGPTSEPLLHPDGSPRIAVPREDGPQARAAMSTQSAYQAPQQGTLGQVGMVTMRGPDGSVKVVSPKQAEFYMARGAQMVG